MAAKNIYHELAELVRNSRVEIGERWQQQLIDAAGRVITVLGKENIKKRSDELLAALIKALPTGDDINDAVYTPVRDILRQMSSNLTRAGCTPSETAIYVFSMKDALLKTLPKKYPQKEKLFEVTTLVNQLIDQLGLLTFESYVETKNSLIREQQRSLVETAAPVVRVWDKVLMVPLIGILDSERTQLVMDKLLSGIEETQSRVVILDITGIPTVDTLVARHLISTANAVQLMGATCVVTGISARIAQTIVQMGIDLSGINTKASMADGLNEAFNRLGLKIIDQSCTEAHNG